MSLVPAIGLTVVSLLLLLLHLFSPVKLDAAALGLVAIAALPWLAIYLSEMELPGGFRFKLREQVRENTQKIDALLRLSMGKDAYHNLVKLHEDRFDRYWRGLALTRELEYLYMVGYIDFRKEAGVKGVDDVPQNCQDPPVPLMNYVHVTDAGREFIRLRQEALQNRAK
jgi:hypothetical protein